MAEVVARVRASVVRVATDKGLGSGAIYEVEKSTGSALIITNDHVISGAASVTVTVSEKTNYAASVIGKDANRDLAILRICCSSEFAPFALANPGSVRVGDQVVVLGYPLGVTTLRVSQGIVSGLQFNSARSRQEIQTDAAINPGNSGGPLVLLNGQLVGIVTWRQFYASDGRPTEGLGYAMSVETVSNVAPALARGQSPQVATPTPNPFVRNSKYESSKYGHQVNVPEGWVLDSQNPDVLILSAENSAAIIRITTKYVGAEFPNTAAYLKKWTLKPSTDWVDFKILKQQTIYRSTVDDARNVEGHEFQAEFKYLGQNWVEFTHWFVLNGWLWEVGNFALAEIFNASEYSDLRITLQFAFISFHPPGANSPYGALPTATPTRVPTPTTIPIPTATPIPPVVTQGFGPVDGTLKHNPDINTIKTYSANIQVADFVAEVTFNNPYSSADGTWDYGFIFRAPRSGTFDAVVVTSRGSWLHYGRNIDQRADDELLASGAISGLPTGRGTDNRLRLVATGTQGELYVNDQLVGVLRLAAGQQGDVKVITGYFRGDERSTAETKFAGFQVCPVTQRVGPLSGQITGQTGLISLFPSGVITADSIAEATFLNPSQQQWSYGFMVRHSASNTFDAVFVRYDGQWYHYTRSGTVESSQLVSRGFVAISPGSLARNTLRLTSIGGQAWLQVNGLPVARLNLGTADVFGDVAAMTGFFVDDEKAGSITKYEAFSVWVPSR